MPPIKSHTTFDQDENLDAVTPLPEDESSNIDQAENQPTPKHISEGSPSSPPPAQTTPSLQPNLTNQSMSNQPAERNRQGTQRSTTIKPNHVNRFNHDPQILPGLQAHPPGASAIAHS